MARVARRSRILRVAMALALAGSSTGAIRLLDPPIALAIDCNLLSGPIANPDPSTPGDPAWQTLEDQDLRINDPSVFANDQCIETLITSWELWDPYGGSFSKQGGDLFFTPWDDFFGYGSVEYRYTSWATSNWALVTITVLPVNDAPYLDLNGLPDCLSITVAEDSGPYAAACTITGFPGADYEGSQTVTGHATAANAALFSAGPALNLAGSPRSGSLTFTPKANAHGTTLVSVWVTDDGGLDNGGIDFSAPVGITINISSVDDAPVATDDAYSTAFGRPLSVQAGSGLLKNDSDVDGPALTAAKVSGPAHGVVTVATDGSFTYTPEGGYSGQDTFTYRATSGGLHDDATVRVTVLASGATVSPPTPAPTPAPGATAAASAGTPSADPSDDPQPSSAPSATGLPTPVPSPDLAASPAPTSAPTVPGGPAESADTTPWLLVLLILIVVVIGATAGLYRYLRSRRSGPPAAA